MVTEYIIVSELVEPTSVYDWGWEKGAPIFQVKKLAVPHTVKVWMTDDYMKLCKQVKVQFYFEGKKYSHTIFIDEEFFKYATTEKDIVMFLVDEISKRHNWDHAVSMHFRGLMLEILGIESKNDYMYNYTLNEGGIVANNPAGDIAYNDAYYYKQNAIPEGGNIAAAAMHLPGMDTKIKYPCKCASGKAVAIKVELYYVIQHLNDSHIEWTREKIADWLDELQDSGQVNLDFEPWTEDTETKTTTDGWQDLGYTTEGVEFDE